MHKSIMFFLNLLFLGQIALSAQSEDKLISIKNIFKEHIKSRNSFYIKLHNKKSFTNELNAVIDFNEKNLKSINTLELAIDHLLYTNEGNEIAYDRELLRPLEELVASQFSADGCISAGTYNKSNVKSEEFGYQEIDKIIKSLCK